MNSKNSNIRSYSMSLLTDSKGGLCASVLYMDLVRTYVYNENKYIIAKPTIWMCCIINRGNR